MKKREWNPYVEHLCIVLPCIIAFGLSGCGDESTSKQTEADPPVLMLSRADVARVTRGDVETGPAVSGVLTASLTVNVKARRVGDILAVHVQEGSIVKKGQSLAELDTRELEYQIQSARADLSAAEAELKNARISLERTERLLKEGVVAPRDLESAQAAVEMARAQTTLRLARVHEMKKVIADAQFPSPISGVVSRRAVEPGDHVSENDVVFTIVDPDIMEVTASISSEDVGQVRVGLPVSFHVEGYGERTFEGRIVRINPAADPATRQITVHVQIPNPTRKLIGGLFATGRVITGRIQDSLLIPSDTIRQGTSGRVVYRIADGEMTAVPVTPSLQDATTGRVAVTGDLRVDDLILVGPTTDIASGRRVSLATADSTEGRN